MNRLILTTALICVAIAACKKKENTGTKADCETNNYGILEVTFDTLDMRHSILVTIPGTASFIEKIVPAGKSSDTMHLKPSSNNPGGTWPVSFSRINGSGAALNQKNQDVGITGCNTTKVHLGF